MKKYIVHFGLMAAFLLVVSIVTVSWIGSASKRLTLVEAEKNKEGSAAALAGASDEGYCTGELKTILRRVLTSCGIIKGGSTRGCQPTTAKNVAAMSGDDFNKLFLPMAKRAAIIQFEKNGFELDESATSLLDRTFSDQKGASYFLVVARASMDGSVKYNAELSEKRANSVLEYLKAKFNDPDLEKEVGLLWLGKEYAQLDEQFCSWSRSKPEQECKPEHINRSAFVTWIDCRL